MNDILFGIVLVACTSAGLALGLYFGERGRRRQIENLLVTGTPTNPKAQRLTPLADSEEIARQHARPFTEATLQRGAELLLREAKEAGIAKTPEEARIEAEHMLRQAATGGFDDEPISPLQ